MVEDEERDRAETQWRRGERKSGEEGNSEYGFAFGGFSFGFSLFVLFDACGFAVSASDRSGGLLVDGGGGGGSLGVGESKDKGERRDTE